MKQFQQILFDDNNNNKNKNNNNKTINNNNNNNNIAIVGPTISCDSRTLTTTTCPHVQTYAFMMKTTTTIITIIKSLLQQLYQSIYNNNNNNNKNKNSWQEEVRLLEFDLSRVIRGNGWDIASLQHRDRFVSPGDNTNRSAVFDRCLRDSEFSRRGVQYPINEMNPLAWLLLLLLLFLLLLLLLLLLMFYYYRYCQV